MNKITLIFLSLLLNVGILFAQDGAYDTSFGDDGIVLTDLGGIQSGALGVIQQTDSKLLVTAYNWDGADDYTMYLLRYLSDGNLDPSFGDDGKVITNSTYGASTPYIQNNNIIVAGQYNNTYLVKRYTNSGELDTSFADNGTLAPFISGQNARIQIFDDNSFVIEGGFQSNGTTSSLTLQKYLPNGTIDTSFGTNGVAEAEIPFIQENPSVSRRFKIQNDGSILILGDRKLASAAQLIFIKFLADGSLDSSFGNNGTYFYEIASSTAGSIVAVFDIDENGKIIVAGSIGSCQLGVYPFIKRFLPSGPIDTTFGDSGSANTPEAWDHSNPFQVTFQENNRILIGWNQNICVPEAFSFMVSRIYENGYIDSSFSLEENTIGLQPNSSYSFILQDDGKIITTARTSIPLVNNNGDAYIGRHQNNPLGIAEENISPITVFPNPSNGVFNLKNQKFINSPFTVNDINGRTLLSGNFLGAENRVDLSSFSTGMYFLKISGTTIKLLRH
ncbi:T9SS type A sorting domain-containing protein [Aequorivita xiaoshiensis]|uniref:T9SS type A sorting domain-containing protein n=1 Tax=Aequorivita xiaoshiensis TaxID=2874476 RepID=A0A9X1R111_9FLAO|nr:T9SS type A sorting domain-containing protein [Aequorivita xiaoshiensis]MCG2429977.1 T9SS type A sorting domain-containing protein [Aequorivita xiaoshiensis]